MHSFTYPLVCSSANVKTFHRVTIGDGWHVPLRIPGPAQATQQSYLRALSPAFRQCERKAPAKKAVLSEDEDEDMDYLLEEIPRRSRKPEES
ncbi:hypothetical protein MGN70_003025 [Eutypa lata]|nr:hypothetical protein MGN70_003025 [Eutypa lata]